MNLILVKTYFLIVANRILGIFGARLISNKAIENIETIIERSVENINAGDPTVYTEGLSCIIFSKDRPLQLFALIESLAERWDDSIEYKIIYKASSNEYESAYSSCIIECARLGLSIVWIQQKGLFKNVFLNTLNQIRTKKLLFLTDDNIAIDNFDSKTLPNLKCCKQIVSLRHSPDISSSYNLRRNRIIRPRFSSIAGGEFLYFLWFEGQGEWSDPYSLDGHIYNTRHIKSIIYLSEFSAPNTLELAMKYFGFLQSNSVGFCCQKSVIVNIPLNLTQTEWRNRHDGLALSEALSLWQRGYKFDVVNIDFDELTSTHVPMKLNIISRIQNEEK